MSRLKDCFEIKNIQKTQHSKADIFIRMKIETFCKNVLITKPCVPSTYISTLISKKVCNAKNDFFKGPHFDECFTKKTFEVQKSRSKTFENCKIGLQTYCTHYSIFMIFPTQLLPPQHCYRSAHFLTLLID